MTSYAPTPTPPGSATRMRVRWDNIAIVLAGAAVATVAVVLIMTSADRAPSAPAKHDAMGHEQSEAPVLDDVSADGSITIDDAVSLVDEARTLMSEGRWDEALERFAIIPEDLRDASGATTASADLERLRSEHVALRAQLEAAIEARNFREAQTLLAQLAAIVPLDADLAATQELVDTALTPGAAKGGGTGSTSPASKGSSKGTSGGGSSSKGSSTKPSGTKPSGGGSGTKPSVTGGGSSSSTGSPNTAGSSGASNTSGTSNASGSAATSGTSGSAATAAAAAALGAAASSGTGPSGANAASIADLGIQLTPAQEAELAAALEAALGQLEG